MAKVYNEEFKKQLVKEYIQGKSYPALEKEYGVAKSTLSGLVINIAKNASSYKHILQISMSFLQKKSKSLCFIDFLRVVLYVINLNGLFL